MTYEEWSEDLDRLCCEEMFTDWTADREQFRAQYDELNEDYGRLQRRAEAAEAEQEKLAERVRVLEEAILRHQGANDVVTLVDKDLYAALEEEGR